MEGDRGLSQRQVRGRGGEAAMVGDGDKGLQARERQAGVEVGRIDRFIRLIHRLVSLEAHSSRAYGWCTMSKFVIQPHVRLQEWVAEELGFFKDEGLDYEFQADGFSAKSLVTSSVQTTAE